jgi:CheY-like chemotaxis protein
LKYARAYPILVVEDSDEDFDTVREAAQRLGIANELIHANDVESARELLADVVHNTRVFAFVLLDQSLPGTNGDGLLSEMRAQRELRALPVVVLSGSTRDADCKRCYGAGANAYHIKPVRFDEHVATVQGIFSYWLECAVLPEAHRDMRFG